MTTYLYHVQESLLHLLPGQPYACLLPPRCRGSGGSGGGGGGGGGQRGRGWGLSPSILDLGELLRGHEGAGDRGAPTRHQGRGRGGVNVRGRRGGVQFAGGGGGDDDGSGVDTLW